MYIFLAIIAIFILFYIFTYYKISIDILSFLKKGFIADRGKFGVYCFCGKQGSGKTFSTIRFILNHSEMPIYSNIKLSGITYNYFSGFEELLKINDHHCIIVFDEIFTALTKQSRLNSEVLSFLSQMRKKNIIFITTAQEWLEINVTLRRYVRYQIDCKIITILPFSILIERYRDGEQMKWSNDDNEYIAPIIQTTVSKMALETTKHYDTFEVITLENKPIQHISSRTEKIFTAKQRVSYLQKSQIHQKVHARNERDAWPAEPARSRSAASAPDSSPNTRSQGRLAAAQQDA